jgi:hypothetical protein
VLLLSLPATWEEFELERELSDEILSAFSPPRQMHPSLIWFQDTREKSRVNLIIDEAAGKERD